MIRSLLGLGGAAAIAATALTVAVPAQAQYYGGGAYGHGWHNGYDGYGRGYDYGRGYGRAGYYNYGSYRHYRYRCDRGTGGTIVGAIAGGLLGNAIAGHGDRGVGTILGAGAGALVGRSIDRDC